MKKTILTTFIILLLSSVTFPILQAQGYNGLEYKIDIPENIHYLEYCYFSRQCLLSKRNKTIIKLNVLLIKNNFTPLYK